MNWLPGLLIMLGLFGIAAGLKELAQPFTELVALLRKDREMQRQAQEALEAAQEEWRNRKRP